MTPTPLGRFSGQKADFFRHLFIHNIYIPIEPECSEMDNFDIKKMDCGNCGGPPRRNTCIQNMIYTPFISMVVLTTKT